MSGVESGPALIAWWGAILSTLLAIVKVFELWRDRFRVDVSYNFTGDQTIGNKIIIRNLSNRPLILAHWELLYCSGRWPRRRFEPIENSDFDSGDYRLEPYATHTLHFVEENYFSWSHSALKGRGIFIRLHFAGRKSLLRQVYSQ